MSFTKSDDKNIFALVDCNNFYVSCERVFNPFLINQPVVVLSNNDGCIIARSNEVKDLGIPMGAPFHHYQHTFCLLYTSPSPRDRTRSRMPSSA